MKTAPAVPQKNAFNAARFFKKLLGSLLVFLLLLFCFKGDLYRALVQYKPIGQRENIRLDNDRMLQQLDAWLMAHKNAGLDETVSFARTFATSGIRYTFGKCSTNPNRVKDSRQTNCIGYSALFQSVVQYLLEKQGRSGKVTAEHKIGQLYLAGYNLHRLFKDPAFKDHDYNVVHDHASGERYVIDPTISACLGINTVVEAE